MRSTSLVSFNAPIDRPPNERVLPAAFTFSRYSFGLRQPAARSRVTGLLNGSREVLCNRGIRFETLQRRYTEPRRLSLSQSEKGPRWGRGMAYPIRSSV